MAATNINIFQMAIRALDAPDRGEIERDVIERYQRAVVTSGQEMAEALARSEALSVLLQLDFDAYAYLRPYLR